MDRGSFHRDFPGTTVLLLTTVAFYLLETIYHWKGGGVGFLQSAVEIPADVVVSLGANSLRHLERGEVWRLISYAFLHGSIVHILLNGWMVYDLGRACEPLLGTARFTVVYIASAIAAGLASAAYAGYRGEPWSPSVGASGALFGLFGLLLAFSIRHRERGLRNSLLESIIYTVIFTVFIPRADHAAHAGGLLTGAVFGFFTPRPVTSRNARRWRIPFQVTAAATLVALAIAIWRRARLPLGG